MTDILEADVVIVGYGGSGACAAIEAHDAGASILILEKTDEGGGSTRESSGSLRVIADRTKAAHHFSLLTEGITPPSLMKIFADGAAEIPNFIVSLGGATKVLTVATDRMFPKVNETTAFPDFEDADGVGDRMRVDSDGIEGGGAALWNVLEKAVNSRRNIKIIYNAPANKLIRSPDGIVGVEAGSGRIIARAKRAVILTCGGFAWNPELQLQYLGATMPALSPPGRNTGDGIKMAQEVGADLWHMNATAAGWGFKVPGFDAAFFAQIYPKGFFIVDQLGKRYVNEPELDSHSGGMVGLVMDPIAGRYRRLPSYLIFNENARKMGSIVTTQKHSYNQRFSWSADNKEEIEKGWIKVASTLPELADKLGIDKQGLQQTAVRYNRACEIGEDEFGRSPDKMEPITQPPYYGIAIWPTLLNTQGGPRRNERSQIVEPSGLPIPRLYAAGELGSIWGPLYPGAGNVCEAMVFGRIAGRNAAGEHPLSERIAVDQSVSR